MAVFRLALAVITITSASGQDRRTSLNSDIPLPSGIRMSITARSNGCSRIIVSAVPGAYAAAVLGPSSRRSSARLSARSRLSSTIRMEPVCGASVIIAAETNS